MTTSKRSTFRSKLVFEDLLPAPSTFSSSSLLIYDRELEKLNPDCAKWISGFSARYPVTAGETLKDLDQFPFHLKKILRLPKEGWSRSHSEIIALGGGSVGDFAGFVASVIKRGVKLSHLPSTWLAAVDSAHGGKTALNVCGIKNQVGTFYPAHRTFLLRPLLKGQAKSLATDALSEVVKMYLLSSSVSNRKSFVKDLARFQAGDLEASEFMWKYLKPSIQAKYAFVERDPFEERGLRALLNLGHTFGHAVESRFGLSHGKSVAWGLQFARQWSESRSLISQKLSREIESSYLSGLACRGQRPGQFKKPELRALLAQDKKRGEGEFLNFVFLKGIGRPSLQKVQIDELVDEASCQGWIK